MGFARRDFLSCLIFARAPVREAVRAALLKQVLRG
jgi:hypothetical protein